MVDATREDAALEPEQLARALFARDRGAFRRIGTFIDAHSACPYEMFLAELTPVAEA